MFNNQQLGERGGSRPIVVGLVLLLLFLSTTQDWSSPARTSTRTQLKGIQPLNTTEETKEEIIRRLVNSNEELEKENEALRLEILKLKEQLRNVTKDEGDEGNMEAPSDGEVMNHQGTGGSSQT